MIQLFLEKEHLLKKYRDYLDGCQLSTLTKPYEFELQSSHHQSVKTEEKKE